MSALRFTGQKKQSKEMETLILSLKINKIKVPKYLLFKIFEYFEEIFLLSYKHILPFNNGVVGTGVAMELTCNTSHFSLVDNLNKQFAFFDFGVNLFLFEFILI